VRALLDRNNLGLQVHLELLVFADRARADLANRRPNFATAAALPCRQSRKCAS
jgi:hypothetical protein